MNAEGASSDLTATPTRVAVAAAPRWVTGFKLAPPQADDVTNAERPTEQLLIDRQLFPKKHASYLRHAQRANSADGAETLAKVTLDFAPQHERLIIHSIRVWRGEEAEDHADEAHLAVRTTGEGSGRRRRVTLDLGELEVGDVVDVAITRVAKHPLGDRFHAAIPTAYPVPVRRWSVSLLEQEDSRLQWRCADPDAEPVSREVKEGWFLHRWREDRVPPLRVEANAPGWHLQGPVLEFTEFEDWAEVAHAAAALWPPPESPEALVELALEILEVCDEPEERAEAACAFVRDEIRHIEAEEGFTDLAPRPVAEILETRRGDGKDLSRLLSMLFRQLKIPCSTMLVNTRAARAVGEMLPTPAAFDHAIVCAKVGEEMVWIDPASGRLTPSLLASPPPSYGYALQVSEKAKGLTELPDVPEDGALLVVKENYRVESFDRPVELEVQRRASGYEAERIRDRFADRDELEIREMREAEMRERHPGCRAVGTWSIELSRSSDRVSFDEQYEIDDFAGPDGDGHRSVPIAPTKLLSRFPGTPEERDRKSPWALTFPCRIRHELHFNLPVQLPPESEQDFVDSDFFGFKSQTQIEEGQVDIVYRYWSKTDHIPVDELDVFRAEARRLQTDSRRALALPSGGREWREPEIAEPDPGAPPVRRVKHVRRSTRTLRMVVSSVLTLAAVGAVAALVLSGENDEPPPNRDGTGAESATPAGGATDTMEPAEPRASDGYQPLTRAATAFEDYDTPPTEVGGGEPKPQPELEPAPAAPPTSIPAAEPSAEDEGFRQLFKTPEDKDVPAFRGSLLDGIDDSATADEGESGERKFRDFDVKL